MAKLLVLGLLALCLVAQQIEADTAAEISVHQIELGESAEAAQAARMSEALIELADGISAHAPEEAEDSVDFDDYFGLKGKHEGETSADLGEGLEMKPKQAQAMADYMGKAIEEFYGHLMHAEDEYDAMTHRGETKHWDKTFAAQVAKDVQARRLPEQQKLDAEISQRAADKAERMKLGKQQFYDYTRKVQELSAVQELGAADTLENRMTRRRRRKRKASRKAKKAKRKARRKAKKAKRKARRKAKKAKRKARRAAGRTKGKKKKERCDPPPKNVLCSEKKVADGGNRTLPDDECYLEEMDPKKCLLHGPQHGTFSASEWSFAEVEKKWGTRRKPVKQSCYDWRWELEKCGWYHKIFRSLINTKKHLYPCLATSYARVQQFKSYSTGKNCNAMLLNGFLDKAGLKTSEAPQGKLLVKQLKHLNDDLVGKVWTVAYEFGNEKCTNNFRNFYIVMDVLLMFGKLVVQVLPGALKMIGKIVLNIMEGVKKVLRGPKAFVDGLWKMKEKIFAPVDNMWAMMGDVINMVEIMIKISSADKAVSAALEKEIKGSGINPLMTTLNKFVAVAVKVIFENPAVKGLSKGPLAVCTAGLKAITKNPVFKAVQKGAAAFKKALHKKFCILKKCFTAAKIIKKASGLLSKLMKPVMKLMEKILKPIKKMFQKILAPLFAPLYKALKFPGLPGRPREPDFMNQKTVNAQSSVGKFDPFTMYKTCAFNVDFVKQSGTNQCNCCLSGLLDPKKPAAALIVSALRPKLCRMMSHGLKTPERVSPLPVKCWSEKHNKARIQQMKDMEQIGKISEVVDKSAGKVDTNSVPPSNPAAIPTPAPFVEPKGATSSTQKATSSTQKATSSTQKATSSTQEGTGSTEGGTNPTFSTKQATKIVGKAYKSGWEAGYQAAAEGKPDTPTQ